MDEVNEIQCEINEENNFDKKLKNLSKKLKSGFNINFKNGTVIFYVITPRIEIKKIESEIVGDTDNYKIVEHFVKQEVLKKRFKADTNYTSIDIDNRLYDIPDYLNKKMLVKNDVKTWEILFYDIFSNKIRKELKVYKDLLDSQIQVSRQQNIGAEYGN